MKKILLYTGISALAGVSAQGALVSVNITLRSGASDADPQVAESVDRDNTFGVFADDDATYVWNDVSQALANTGTDPVSNPATDTLVDTDGVATTVTVDIDGNPARAADWGVDTVLGQGNWDNTGAITFTIGGLIPDTTYQLAVFSSDPHPFEATPTVNTVAATTFGGTVVSSGANDHYDDSSVAGGRDTFWYFSVDSDSSGNLAFAQGSAASFNTLVGFQLDGPLVPEPSSALLAGFGLLALAQRRRR